MTITISWSWQFFVILYLVICYVSNIFAIRYSKTFQEDEPVDIGVMWLLAPITIPIFSIYLILSSIGYFIMLGKRKKQ